MNPILPIKSELVIPQGAVISGHQNLMWNTTAPFYPGNSYPVPQPEPKMFQGYDPIPNYSRQSDGSSNQTRYYSIPNSLSLYLSL
jgi:hypothetical protein